MAALATVGGVLAAISAAVGSTPALADTGTVTYSCSSSSGALPISVDITGSITPPGVADGDSFNLTDYQVQVTVPPSVASLLVTDHVSTMSGTTGAVVNAVGASPSQITPLLSWGPVSVSSGGFSFSFPTPSTTTVGPFTASGGTLPELTAGSLNTILDIPGFGNISSTCSPPAPAPVIAGATLLLGTTPSATSIVAGDPTGLTDTATLTGVPAFGSPTGNVTFYVCGPPATSCSSTGAPVGTVGLTAGADDTATATSPVLPTPSAGTYCFDALYSGDSNYPSTEDGSSEECFTVTPPIPCNPSCTGTVSSTAETVAVSGTSSTEGNLYLQVGQTSLACPAGYDSPAPFTTLQETDFVSTAPLSVTDTVLNDPSLKHFGVCFQTLQGTFMDKQHQAVTTGLLPKCKKRNPVAPCIASTEESAGDVVAGLLVPANDPRFHGGGASPVVTTVSPASILPKTKVTIRGLYLSGATVRLGGTVLTAKASATKISFTVPAGTPAESIPVTITTSTGTTIVQALKIT